MPLPTHIDEDIFTDILQQAQTSSDDRKLLQKWYAKDNTADAKTANSSGEGGVAPTHAYVLKQDYR